MNYVPRCMICGCQLRSGECPEHGRLEYNGCGGGDE